MEAIRFLGQNTTYAKIKNDAKTKAYMIVDFMRPNFGDRYIDDIKTTQKVLEELVKEEPKNPHKKMWDETLERIQNFFKK